jgi:hypothetical protein
MGMAKPVVIVPPPTPEEKSTAFLTLLCAAYLGAMVTAFGVGAPIIGTIMLAVPAAVWARIKWVAARKPPE